jgi:hypothetical protein
MGHPYRERHRLSASQGKFSRHSHLTSANPSLRIQTRYDFGGTWLGWDRITRVPIQASLVDFELLSSEQRMWLKKHNDTCRDDLMPLLTKKGDESVRKWLKKTCI